MSRPIDFVTGKEERGRAARSLSEYLTSYTGRHFETFTALSPPNSFTANDIVAVEMLSVKVPATTSIGLCVERSNDVTEFLKLVPKEAVLWDPGLDLTKEGPLWRLWDLVKQCGLGSSVVRSKLLATKRPHAVPIYDQHVAAALGASPRDYWSYWRSHFDGRDGEALISAVESLASELHAEDLSVLRTLDIVIWMRQHGYRSADKGNWQARFGDFVEPVRPAK